LPALHLVTHGTGSFSGMVTGEIDIGGKAMVTTTPARQRLSQELNAHLQRPQLVLVTTLDSESKWPSNNLITWVTAIDEGRVRLAADSGGRILRNIQADDRVLLTVIAEGACHSIEGRARMLTELLEGPTLKLGCAEVQVEAVRDVTFVGGRVTTPPAYEVTYDPAMKEQLDRAVFEAMKKQ
jgi:predicted pyridoxine 5'-phosphate oxidase superfamily flavin-nucleotide-binding protein